MPAAGSLRVVLAGAGFRRLYATRLTGQCADGVFQASLAGAVLFNPERQADPVQIAAGFAVLLMPYSLVGPFAGVLLDRWSRQRTLVVANLTRCLLVAAVAAEIGGGLSGPAFYASALVTISANRFVLSGLSAALPHVVPGRDLVTANSLSTTSGSIATAIGGGLALAVRAVAGSGDHGYAVVALSAALPYAASALAAGGFTRAALGPDDDERARRESVRAVLLGMRAGVRHLAERRPAAYALSVTGAHRFLYGVSTIATLLLYRNYFRPDGLLRTGLAGLGQVVAVTALGALLAAVVTPPVARQVGKPAWITAMLLLAGVTQVTLGLPFTPRALVPGALLLGFAAQGAKICVDTTVQEAVDDDFRGRVFSLYDTLFNITYVVAAVVGAAVLPVTGKSYAVLLAISFGYVLSATAYGVAARRLARVPVGDGPVVTRDRTGGAGGTGTLE